MLKVALAKYLFVRAYAVADPIVEHKEFISKAKAIKGISLDEDDQDFQYPKA
jgi:hypothetical protein